MKLITLLHSDRATHIRGLGTYIFKAFEQRNDILAQLNKYF